MDRKTFCKMLASARKSSGLKQIELCTKMQMLPAGILRIENGTNSFNMDLCLRYISAINHKLILIKNEDKIVISQYNTLLEYIKQKRHEFGSLAKTSEVSGLSKQGISNIEVSRTVMRIDSFLALASVFDIQITVIKDAH